MTGQRRQPEELREKVSQLIRYEQQSMPTASLGRIKTLDEESRRASVELLPDGTTETNVPVATTFAADGVGDLAPLNPEESDGPVHGIVLYLHHGLEKQLAADGTIKDGEREHEDDNCVFMPAQLWFDGQEVPEHNSDERRIDHPKGTSVTLDPERAGLDHDLGGKMEVVGKPEPELGEAIKEPVHEEEEYGSGYVTQDTSNREWPIAAESGDVVARIGTEAASFTMTKRGAAIEPANAKLASGALNDGDRRPLTGPHQHFHLIDHGHDEYSLAGPQLSFREFVAWLTDETHKSQLRNHHRYRAAEEYAKSYLSWLEAEMGRSIDPTDPLDWPDPEPMPTLDELEQIADIDWGTTIKPRDALSVAGARDRIGLGSISPHVTLPPEASATASGTAPTINAEINNYGQSYGDSYGSGP